MTEIFCLIEEVETIGDEVNDLREALIQLSNHPDATFALANALIDAAQRENSFWQDIERREDFKAQFADRDSARLAFLREYFAQKSSF